MGQVTLKIENIYLCFLLKSVLYPWEAPWQPLDQCPAYSKPFSLQQRAVICSLFRVVFTRCLAVLSGTQTKGEDPKGPHQLLTGGAGRGQGPGRSGGVGHVLEPASPSSLVSEHCCWCCTSHVCLGTSSALGRGAVINHPIRREPFPSAPLCQHILLCCLFFLVESSSYKWYLCNLARMF